MFNILNKPKYKAWYFIKEGSTYKFKKRKKFVPDPKKKLITYKGNHFDYDIDNPCFRKGLVANFFFDYMNGKQITTQEVLHDDKVIKELLYIDESIKQTYEALGKQKLKLNWIHLVFVFGFALLLGWIIGTFIPISLLGAT